MATRPVYTKAVSHQGSLLSKTALNILPIAQSGENWCWAACATMIAVFFRKPGITQCALATTEFNQTNCCANPKPLPCDQGLSIQQITNLYTRLGFPVSQTGPLTFAQIQTEINARRPIQIASVFNSGQGGHAFLITDALIVNGDESVYLINPLSQGANGVATLAAVRAMDNAARWNVSWTKF